MEDLPIVTGSECQKGYVYHKAIELIDDKDVDSDSELEQVDDAMYMEMAYDKM